MSKVEPYHHVSWIRPDSSFHSVKTTTMVARQRTLQRVTILNSLDNKLRLVISKFFSFLLDQLPWYNVISGCPILSHATLLNCNTCELLKRSDKNKIDEG